MLGSSSLKGEAVEVLGPTVTSKSDALVSDTLTVIVRVLMVVMVDVESVYNEVERETES